MSPAPHVPDDGTGAEPCHFAYADPPYIGQARRHYQQDEVDHKKLIEQLVTLYPDGVGTLRIVAQPQHDPSTLPT